MLTHLNSGAAVQSQYDVCVIGAGAAGITIAQKLRKNGLRVFLAEGGGETWEDESQAIYAGKVTGDEYFDLETARLRFFGGTTNHWGGMCRPLEEIDFKAKPDAPLTAWPISRADLDPYLDEARDVVEIPKFESDQPMAGSDDLRRVHFSFSEPVRFAEKYGPVFEQDSGIDVFLHANAQDLIFDEGRIQTVRFENFEGHSVNVRAKTYVLACGGIENSRLLLQWNRQYNNALGNVNGLVGRYFMEHLTQTIGEVLFCDDFSLPDDNPDVFLSLERFYVAPTQSFMQRNGTLNCRVRLDRSASMSCKAPNWFSRLLGREPDMPARLAWVRSSSEQEPVYENHVALSDEMDRFDNPRVDLHWSRSEKDRATFRTVALELGKYFADHTQARLRLNDWVLSEEHGFSCEGGGHCPGGYHHIGGTRMAETTQTGVVDRDAMVFGSGNLYCAGSSVFPSGGYCNPTFSIVQLSLRLADHLTRVVAP